MQVILGVAASMVLLLDDEADRKLLVCDDSLDRGVDSRESL